MINNGSPLAEQSRSQPMRVLLADDDSDDRELFVEAMNEIDPAISVVTVEDGDKLMSELGNSVAPPDLIFLDVNMPRKNGKECLYEIRQIPGMQHVPIIIYSTSLSQRDIDDGWEKGASGFMKKPDSYSKLKEVFRQVMSIDLKKAAENRKEKILFNIKRL
jgi:CheY-like chemotaxis protein